MKILYAASEAGPFVKTGGLGEVAETYPQALAEAGVDVRVILPLYDQIPAEEQARMELLENFTIHLGLEQLYCGLYRLRQNQIVYYFVENRAYFGRGQIYGCPDDDVRFAFFSKAVCECLQYMDWNPDIVHCNDWQTALIPLYLRSMRRREKTLFTIHNVEFQGRFQYQTLTDVFGLSGALFAAGTVELDGSVNLMKGAAEVADCLTTVSPGYGAELTHKPGIGPVLAAQHLRGIRNGIPKSANPWDCPLVHRPYNQDSVEEKLFNKLWMQEKHGLTVSEQPPVFGCVSRLLPRKGFSLLAQVLPKYLAQGAQLVVTGQGDEQVAAEILRLKEAFPKQVDLQPYSEENAVEIYSSADMLLMPSREEPCGTAQMQAMAYGTIPVVHYTGGLKDTVRPYGRESRTGWGFAFSEHTPEGLETALEQALAAYEDVELWETLEKRCMALDFSWDKSVAEYLTCYESIL